MVLVSWVSTMLSLIFTIECVILYNLRNIANYLFLNNTNIDVNIVITITIVNNQMVKSINWGMVSVFNLWIGVNGGGGV